MVAFTQLDIKEAIINYLRSNIPDPAGRGSTATELFSGDGSTTTFTLANKGGRYITNVTVDGAAQNLIEHYTQDLKFDTQYPTITFRTAPASGTNNISVTYGYGATWIYPDFPRSDATSPRIGITPVSELSNPAGFNTTEDFYEPVYQITVFVREGKAYTISGKDYAGQALAGYLSSLINDQLLGNRWGSIYNCIDIEHVGGRMMWQEDKKVIYDMQDYRFKFRRVRA